MTPDANTVSRLVLECLFEPGEPLEPFVEVEGLSTRFRFHPERLRARRELIAEQLPPQFRRMTGGGWSFLEACVTREGEAWGEHSNVESLMCLGMAAGFVSYCAARKHWPDLPGGMPSFVIDVEN